MNQRNARRGFTQPNGYPKGFTLIELLVVVLIISILAAIAVPQYQKAVAYSEYNSLKPLVRSLAEAEERYYIEHGTYTLDVDELDVQFPYTTKNTTYYGGRAADYTSPFGSFQIIRKQFDGDPRVTASTRSENEKNTYGIWLRQESQGRWAAPGKQVCRGYNSISKKICQKETGKTEADALDNLWVYP